MFPLPGLSVRHGNRECQRTDVDSSSVCGQAMGRRDHARAGARPQQRRRKLGLGWAGPYQPAIGSNTHNHHHNMSCGAKLVTTAAIRDTAFNYSTDFLLDDKPIKIFPLC